jgi:hypothetical protein
MLLSACILALHNFLDHELGCSEFSSKLTDADFVFAFHALPYFA